MSSRQLLQESVYNESADYRRGSPHLSHWSLYDRLTAMLRDEIRRLSDADLPLDVLEIGSGHGGYTEPALAAGCQVTAVEMSRPSVAELDRRFSTNRSFRSVLDPDGSLAGVDQEFSLVLCVSVLHHIPDYLTYLEAVTQRLRAGGTLLVLQDPVWFARSARTTRLVDRGGFYAWRLGQGDVVRGLATVSRRLRGKYDPDNPSDMVEYHAVRQGVDEAAVKRLLEPSFGSVSLFTYWSNQSRIVQRVGEDLRLRNTFGISARRHRQEPGRAPSSS